MSIPDFSGEAEQAFKYVWFIDSGKELFELCASLRSACSRYFLKYFLGCFKLIKEKAEKNT